MNKTLLPILLLSAVLSSGCGPLSGDEDIQISKFDDEEGEVQEVVTEENCEDPLDVSVLTQENHQTIQVGDVLSFDVPEGFASTIRYDEYCTMEASGYRELVSIFEQSDMGSDTPEGNFGMKVSVEFSDFTSFEDFATDMENNYINDLMRVSSGASEADIEAKLKEFEGQYSFERKEIGGFHVLIHKRNFYGMIGNIYYMYVYTEKGIFTFGSEADHELLDQIYFSLKAI